MVSNPTTKLLYSARGVAQALDCSLPWAKKLIYSGQIASMKLGGARRVRHEDLVTFIEQNGQPDRERVHA